MRPDQQRGERPQAGTAQSLHASILAGPDVDVLEVSPKSLLLASEVRLAPGAGICLNVTVANQTHLVSGRVGRVDTALAEGHVKYHAEVILDSETSAFDLDSPKKTASPAPVRPAARPAPARPSAQAPPSPKTSAPAAPSSKPDEEQLQILRTALRSSEAQRKELADELASERATWEEHRQVLELLARKAEETATAAGEQLTAAREAERLLAAQHSKERAAWTKERKGLEDRATQARERFERIESETAEARALSERLSSEVTAARDQHAQASADLMEAREESEQLGRELAAAREDSERLSGRLEEQGAKLRATQEEQERLQAVLENLRADLAAAEQKIAAHEKDRRDWAAQKERLTGRLQTTEKWCADQQDMLYQLRQQIGKAFTLVDDWKPAEPIPAHDEEEDSASAATA